MNWVHVVPMYCCMATQCKVFVLDDALTPPEGVCSDVLTQSHVLSVAFVYRVHNIFTKVSIACNGGCIGILTGPRIEPGTSRTIS